MEIIDKNANFNIIVVVDFVICASSYCKDTIIYTTTRNIQS